MIKMGAAQVVVSLPIVPYLCRTPKTLDPTFSFNAPSSIFLINPFRDDSTRISLFFSDKTYSELHQTSDN